MTTDGKPLPTPNVRHGTSLLDSERWGAAGFCRGLAPIGRARASKSPTQKNDAYMRCCVERAPDEGRDIYFVGYIALPTELRSHVTT